MGNPSLSQAKEWLQLTRNAAKRKDFLYFEYFLVDYHAYYCACRELTESLIIKLITSEKTTPYMTINQAKTAKPGSYQLNLKDLDATEGRQLITMAIDFTHKPPVVFHAFREGSPNLMNPDSNKPCFKDKDSPPCKQKRRRPVGRI